MEKNNKNSLPRILTASIVTIALIITMIPAIGQIASNSSTALSYKVENAVFVDAASKKVTVKFYGNKGNVKKKSKKVIKGKKYGTLPKATRKGHYFQGWYTKKSGGKKVTKSSKLNSKKTVKLYAQWSRIPAKYKNNIGKTLGAMKKSNKDFKALNSAPSIGTAIELYGTKSKVRYITNNGNGAENGIPAKYKNNYSKLKNYKILGIEGEISAIFPGVKKEMHYSDLMKYLGVSSNNYELLNNFMSSANYLTFNYQGLYGEIYWYDGDSGVFSGNKFVPPTIKPNQHVNIAVKRSSSAWKSNEKLAFSLYMSLQQ